jgi:thiol-disulfide isomerase/thioredoxin
MTPEQLASFTQPNQAKQDLDLVSNPLSKYMRQPAIFISLPSIGQYWKQESLEKTENNQYAVYPMSTRDELVLNTPDALMNGQGVVDVFQSCIPNIKNAWDMPIVDVDLCLIAIRIASYGESMEYNSTCPSCLEINNYEIDLKEFLELKIDVSGFEKQTTFKDLKIKVKPITYRALNTQSLDEFEQQRLVTTVGDSELDDLQKQEKFNDILKNMTMNTVRNIASGIEYIETPEGERVTDQTFIDDFVENCDRKLFDELRKHQELIDEGIPAKNIPTTCPDCQHEYVSPFTFDQASFFGSAS